MKPVCFDSDAMAALAAAGEKEATAWKKGHREAAAEASVVALVVFTSGTTPPSPWKNE